MGEDDPPDLPPLQDRRRRSRALCWGCRRCGGRLFDAHLDRIRCGRDHGNRRGCGQECRRMDGIGRRACFPGMDDCEPAEEHQHRGSRHHGPAKDGVGRSSGWDRLLPCPPGSRSDAWDLRRGVVKGLYYFLLYLFITHICHSPFRYESRTRSFFMARRYRESTVERGSPTKDAISWNRKPPST